MTLLLNTLRFVISILAGILIGVIVHYALYRISLPIEPFIYMAF